MPVPPSLLFTVPYSLITTDGTGNATFSGAAFATLAGGGGLVLPSADLLALSGIGSHQGVLLGLLAVLQAPANATAEVQVVVRRVDGRIAPLSGLSVQAMGAGSASALAPRSSPLVALTAFLRESPLVTLRLQGRTTAGTAVLAAPTLAFYRDNRP